MLASNSILGISPLTELDGAHPLHLIVVGDPLSTSVILDLCVEDNVRAVVQRSSLGSSEKRQLFCCLCFRVIHRHLPKLKSAIRV